MATPRQLTQPIAYSVIGAAEAIGISSSKLEEIIKRNDVTPRWVDGKRIIEATELVEYVKTLPTEREL